MNESFTISPGKVYLYTGMIPAGCEGKRYLVHRFITDVPSYQTKVLVEPLDSRDGGEWFTVTLNNFSRRYVLAPDPIAEAVPAVKSPDSPAETPLSDFW